MSDAGTAATPSPQSTPGRPTSAMAAAGAASNAPAVQRQFVNFAFYKLDPAFRRLDENAKIQARSEFLRFFQQKRDGLMCLTYSTVGLKADSDFLLWRISLTPDAFQEQSRDINLTRFVARTSIPALYFDRAYILAPAGGSSSAYQLLAATMQRLDKAGIATFVMRERQT